MRTLRRLWAGRSIGVPAALREGPAALREERGSALIELAVVLPGFSLLLLGIFEMSCAYTGMCSGAYSVRSAARYASLRSNTSLGVSGSGTVLTSAVQTADIQAVAQRTLFVPMGTTPVVTVTYSNPLGASPAGNYVGNLVTVKATWTQSISMPGYSKSLAMSIQGARVVVR